MTEAGAREVDRDGFAKAAASCPSSPWRGTEAVAYDLAYMRRRLEALIEQMNAQAIDVHVEAREDLRFVARPFAR